MNSAPLTFPAVWSLLSLATLLGGSLLAFQAIRRGKLSPPKLGMLLAAGVVICVVGMFFWKVGSVRVLSNTQIAVVHSPREDSSPTPLVMSTKPLPEVESYGQDTALPEWTRQPLRIEGGQKWIVVSSGRFASEQEAELHGFQQAADKTVREYSSFDPRGTGAVLPQHVDLVRETAIKQRFLEVAQHDFGKFQAPMYQLWLQVELTSQLGHQLAEPWRQAAVDVRLRTLASWGLWSTAAAALAAFALRLDAAWKGRRRAAIVGTAVAITLGSLAFLA